LCELYHELLYTMSFFAIGGLVSRGGFCILFPSWYSGCGSVCTFGAKRRAAACNRVSFDRSSSYSGVLIRYHSCPVHRQSPDDRSSNIRISWVSNQPMVGFVDHSADPSSSSIPWRGSCRLSVAFGCVLPWTSKHKGHP
jgi:hypothetical protein